MADNSNISDEKKKISVGKWSGIIGLIGVAANWVLSLFDKGINPSQIIGFINNWPAVLLGIAICIAWVLTCIVWMFREFNCQKNETIRNNNDIERQKKYLEEEEAKRKDLELQLEEEKRKSQEMSVEMARLEERNKGLEREKEFLEKHNKSLIEVVGHLEQNSDREGGKGATNVVCFDGKNRRNT